MGDAIASALDGLRARLQRLERVEALRLIREPSGDVECVSLLAAAGLGVSAVAVEWFTSWDGQAPDGVLGSMDVLPGFYAMPLRDAIRVRADHAWPTGWLPLMADGGGDFYIVDTGSVEGPVYRHRPEDSPELMAGSLIGFLSAANQAFDDGTIFVEDGYLEQDEDAWVAKLDLIRSEPKRRFGWKRR